ncbi:MAG: DUF4381 domain-containing protein [Methylomonas sp.]|jgi:hypothetical protein
MDELPLKDIHLPEAIGFWPPAPGWYMLAVLLPALAVLSIWAFKRARRKTVFKSAGQMLLAIKQDNSLDGLQTLTALSAWLRRVAISTAPRENVAGLSGAAWLAYLDSRLPDAPFSQGAGRCLAESQYRRAAPEDIDLDALFTLCERWLIQQKPAAPTMNFGPLRKLKTK